ncbi:MAG: hypothetical protein JNJ89_07265 [Rubrivivax sp.]|nr:hypothetical protein [Rubrivivax sp.]
MLERLFDVPANDRRIAGWVAASPPGGQPRREGPGERRRGGADLLAHLPQAHRADASLLKLSVCIAIATLALALATSVAGRP